MKWENTPKFAWSRKELVVVFTVDIRKGMLSQLQGKSFPELTSAKNYHLSDKILNSAVVINVPDQKKEQRQSFVNKYAFWNLLLCWPQFAEQGSGKLFYTNFPPPMVIFLLSWSVKVMKQTLYSKRFR